VYPARTALLVIDMQHHFAHEGGSLLVPDADATIPAGRISTLDPFDLESPLRQIAFLFAGQATTAAGVRIRAE
jgi:nicotinamidase-related amidase